MNNIALYFIYFNLSFSSSSYQFICLLELVILSSVAPQTVFQVERFQELIETDTVVFKGKCVPYFTCNNADAFGLSMTDPCQCRCKDSTAVSSLDNKCISMEKVPGSIFTLAKIDQVSPYQLVTKFTVTGLMQDEIYLYLCNETSCSLDISLCTIDFENSFYDSYGWQRIWQNKMDVDFLIVKSTLGVAIQFKTEQCAMNKYSGMVLKLSMQCQMNNQLLSGFAVFFVVGSYTIGIAPKDRTTCSKLYTQIASTTSSKIALTTSSTLASMTSSKIALTTSSTLASMTSSTNSSTSTVSSIKNSNFSKNSSYTYSTYTTVITIKAIANASVINNTYVFPKLIKTFTNPPSLLYIKINNNNTNTALISAAVVLVIVLIGSCIIIIFLYKRWRRVKRRSVNINSNQQLSFEQITYPHPVFFLNGDNIYQNGGSVVSSEGNCPEPYGIANVSEHLSNSNSLSCLEKIFRSLEQTMSCLHKQKSVDISLNNDFDYRMFIDPVSNLNYDGFSVNHFDDLNYNIPEDMIIINNYNNIDEKNNIVSYSNVTNEVSSKLEKPTFKSSSEDHQSSSIEDVVYSILDEENTFNKDTKSEVLCNTQSSFIKPFPNITEDEKNGDHLYDFPESIEPVLKTTTQYKGLADFSTSKNLNSCNKIGNIPINEFNYSKKNANKIEQRGEEPIYSEPEHDYRLSNTSIDEAIYAEPEQNYSLHDN